jgi:hypothetical protein
MGGDDQVLIDGMALAYSAFQGCRCIGRGPPDVYIRSERALELLGQVIPVLVARHAVVVDVPASWLDDLDRPVREEITRHAGALRGALHNRHLMPPMGIGAAELLRLWRAGAMPAVRSLGYAFHFFPHLVRSGERFDPELFQFCFRIAAHHWDELSFEMRAVLIALAGIDPYRAARLVAREGFAIDMFGSGPRRSG